MAIRQGLFAYLPELTDDELAAQVQYAIDNGWGLGVEYAGAEDVHPRNIHWEMWDKPQFRVEDPEDVMEQVRACREAHPDSYVAIKAFSSTRQLQGVRMNIFAQTPDEEPTFQIERQQRDRRRQGYTITSNHSAAG